LDEKPFMILVVAGLAREFCPFVEMLPQEVLAAYWLGPMRYPIATLGHVPDDAGVALKIENL
jgi:hypothetical protein